MEKEPIINSENVEISKFEENKKALTDKEMEDLYNDKDDDYDKPWQKVHNK
ncbi:MAG: hypothetical protein KBC11_00140 [Candidatus Pacebacteria bacterium]|nr:hypothetical protein [Candidatus Paceibacterota bacterium]